MNLYLTKIRRGIKSLGAVFVFFLLNGTAKTVSLFMPKAKTLNLGGEAKTKELTFLGEIDAASFHRGPSMEPGIDGFCTGTDAVFCLAHDVETAASGHFLNVARLDRTVVSVNDYAIGIAYFDIGTMPEKAYGTFAILRKLHQLRHNRAGFNLAYVIDSRGVNGKLDQMKKKVGRLGFDVVVGAEEKLKGRQSFRTNAFGETRICYSLGRFLQQDSEAVVSKAGAAYRIKLHRHGSRIMVEKEGYIPLHVRASGVRCDSVRTVKKGQRFYLHVEKVMKGYRSWNDLIYMQDILDVIGTELPQKYAYLKSFAVNQICARTYELSPGNIFVFRQAIHDKNDKKEESEFWRNRLVVRAITRKSLFIFSYKKLFAGIPHMVIPDPLEAHIKLMAWYRETYVSAKYIGITGSIGKTSTKDMLYEVLRERFNTERSKRNNNVQVKIALGMMNLSANCEMFVQEIGGGRKYGASRHSRMILPDATIVTNIGTAHLGNYQSQQELMEHKLMITDGMKKDGVLFLNGDDPLLWNARPEVGTVFFSVHNKEADYYADNVYVDDGITYFDVVHGTHRVPAALQVLGEYNVLNAVCAYAVAKHFGMKDEEITKGLLNFRTTGIRQNLISVGGYRFFVDCYNASVASIGSSLSVLRQLRPREGGKRIAVVGDVTGVGEFQEDIDKEIAKIINEYDDIDCVVCFGARATYIQQFLQRDGKETVCITSADAFKHWMTRVVKPQDVVMLKGSSKLKMDEKLDDYFGLDLSDQRYVDSSHYVLHVQNECAYRLFTDYASFFKYRGADSTVYVEEQMMGKRVKKITARAFANNGYVEQVYFGHHVLHVGKRAFAGCSRLKAVHFSDSVKYIGDGAFENCRSLEHVTLSKELLHIGENAFRNCKGLRLIEVPKSVGYVAETAFAGCNAVIRYR